MLSTAFTLVSLHIDSIKSYENRISFVFHDLFKTSRLNQNFQLICIILRMRKFVPGIHYSTMQKGQLMCVNLNMF